MNSYLEHYISTNYQSHHTDPISISIASLTSNSHSKTLQFTNSKKTEKVSSDFLILLFCHNILSIAIKATYFEHRLFVQYVDTSGFFRPRSEQSKFTKLLLQGFVQFVGAEEVNLLACAKPSFLFPLSHKNALKKPLKASDLTKWWISQLRGSYEKIIVFSPTVKIQNDSAVVSELPFGDSECPLFEQDVKLCHFNALYSPDWKWNSREFFSTITIREEFNQSDGAIIRAHSKKLPSKESIQTPVEHSNALFQQVLSTLLSDCQFDSIEQAELSSKNLLLLLKENHLHSFSVKAKAPQKRQIPLEEKQPPPQAPPPVHNIQSLIKRKK